jgi:hypothetical protein
MQLNNSGEGILNFYPFLVSSIGVNQSLSPRPIVATLNPILRRASASTRRRPSKTKAGLFMLSYTSCQAISRNSFHSVAITTASDFLQASSAERAMFTCFLTRYSLRAQ